MSDESQWCFTWDPTDVPGGTKSRAALVNKNKWPKGAKIKVAFLDGVAAVQARVKKVVKEWTAPDTAKLKIVFVNDLQQADIRISFQHKGSWSVLGTSCQAVTPKSVATMNYGWLKETTPDTEARRVILHEFGHALGLIHEHQNPAGGIPWNREAVIADLSGPPNKWTEDTIERNMFAAYAEDETNHTKVDLESIMMYPIPKHWVKDVKFAVGLNSTLSPTDKSFIKAQYPT